MGTVTKLVNPIEAELRRISTLHPPGMRQVHGIAADRGESIYKPLVHSGTPAQIAHRIKVREYQRAKKAKGY